MSRSARSWVSVGWISPARMSCPRPRLLRVASACRARARARRLLVLGVRRRAARRRRGVRRRSRPPRAPGRASVSASCAWSTRSSMKAGSTTQIASGEVRPAVVDVRVPAVAGAVAGLAGDAAPSALASSARAASVSSSRSSLPELAAEERRRAARCPAFGEVPTCLLDLFGAVEEGAVVDPDGVGVLVLDDGAVHEGAHVLERLVVQIVGRDPRSRRPR